MACFDVLLVVVQVILVTPARVSVTNIAEIDIFNNESLAIAENQNFGNHTKIVTGLEHPVMRSNMYCSVFPNDKNTIREWLQLAKEREEQEDISCHNFATAFGWWGEKACPHTWDDILKDVERDLKEAHGGLSGASVIVSEYSVMKVLDLQEYIQAQNLLDKLTTQLVMHASLIAPICKILQVKSDSWLLISANIAIDAPKLKLQQLLPYDLKGNWDYSKRNDARNETVIENEGSCLKDVNFKHNFPRGLKITDAFADHHWSDKGIFKYELAHANNNIGKVLIDIIEKDTGVLEEIGLMDYSILLRLVELPQGPRGKDFEDVLAENEAKPLFLAQDTRPSTHRYFLITMGIIDLFMHQDSRGFKNDVGAVVTFSSCTPGDIDPIRAQRYRIRFMRMFGKQIEGRQCLFNVISDQKRLDGFTYFQSEHQSWNSKHEKEKDARKRTWAPATRSNCEP